MIYNFCGESKGKTSAALGTVVRALGKGERVRIVFFMKHWQTSETLFLEKLQKTNDFDIAFFQAGDNNFIYVGEETNNSSFENASDQLDFGILEEKNEEDEINALIGMLQAIGYLFHKPFLIVLDEINCAIEFGLVPEDLVLEFLDRAEELGTHVILTGRGLSSEIAKRSHLITETRKIKHPFDEGTFSIKGLDY